jgi:hypothetical protein
MVFLLKKNNAKTILASSISSSDLVLTVTNASVFPTSGNFIVTVWDKTNYPDPGDDPNMEIIKVTEVSGNTFTIIRAQELTSALSHNNSSAVEMLITAGQIEEIQNAFEEYVTDAPSDDKNYVRRNGTWIEITGSGANQLVYDPDYKCYVG